MKDIIGTAAVLGIYEVKDGPFPSRDQAMAKHGGVLPLNTKLAKSTLRGGEASESWYLLTRNPVITGSQLRNARSGQDELEVETSFSEQTATLRPLHRGKHRQQAGGRVDDQIISVATIQSKIEDQGRINNQLEQESSNLAQFLGRAHCRRNHLSPETSVGPSLEPTPSGKVRGLSGLAAVTPSCFSTTSVAALTRYWR